MAEQNFTLATGAVSEFLSSAGAHRAQEFPDSPDLVAFRGQLLDKAKIYYQKLATQPQGGEMVEAEIAMANSNLGDIDRLRQMNQDAVKEYNQAIAQFGQLSKTHPGKADYREDLAYSWMWLGETLRQWLESSNKPTQYKVANAQKAYDEAIAIQQQLQQSAPGNPAYQQDLARSYYSRGALLYDSGAGDSLPDLQHALALLEPLAAGSQPPGEPAPAQELARVEYNLGLLYEDQKKYEDAAAAFRNATLSLAPLQQKDPRNREYEIEAATYYVSLASALYCENKDADAKVATESARTLVVELAKPDPTVGNLIDQVTTMNKSLQKPLP